MRYNYCNFSLAIALLITGFVFFSPFKLNAQNPNPFRVLHIMSYDSSWAWNQDQFNGFKKGLKGLNVKYRIFEMNTKRNSSEEWISKASREAKVLINTWKPDLIYTNDDNAQKYVVQDYVNTKIPFVFSAVNESPEAYGFPGSTNVTGILEHEHFVQTVRLLKRITPDVKRIAVIFDDGPMWNPVRARMKANQNKLPDVEFVSFDVISGFEEFKQKVTGYQTTVDALALIGIFRFKNSNGKNVPYQSVLRWTAENSRLPDFSFWEDRIRYGTLCSVTISGYEQGLEAGRMAREILVNNKKPSDFVMRPTVKGSPVVSLARAKRLGIRIKSDILLTAKVIETFQWDK